MKLNVGYQDFRGNIVKNHSCRRTDTVAAASIGGAGEDRIPVGVAGSMWMTKSNGPNRAETVTFVAGSADAQPDFVGRDPATASLPLSDKSPGRKGTSLGLPNGTKVTFIDLTDLLA